MARIEGRSGAVLREAKGNRNEKRHDTRENGMGDKGGRKDKAKNDKQKKQSSQDSKKKEKKK